MRYRMLILKEQSVPEIVAYFFYFKNCAWGCMTHSCICSGHLELLQWSRQNNCRYKNAKQNACPQ